MSAADILIDTFAAESALLRATAATAAQSRGHNVHETMARTFVNDAAVRVEMAARTTLAGMTEGDTLRTMLAALRRILKLTPVNTIALRRIVADAMVERKGYPLA